MTPLEARPFPYAFDLASTLLVIIDMQRDFIEPGGFGESLGNDVSRLSAIVPALAPQAQEWVIDKPGKGMFYNTGLHERLQAAGISHLIFMGVTTEVCVQTSMREANDRGYDCLLLEDCTESYFEHFRTATLEMIRAQGAIVGWTGHSADLLAALAQPRS